MARNIAGRVTITSNLGTPNLFFSNTVPGGSGAVANVPSPYAYAMPPSHHTTYTQQYLLNIQRQLTANWALEVGYLGGLSRHLQGFQDVNQATPATVGSAASRLPFPGFSNIQMVQDGGTGNYNSLSVKATRRFSQGFSVIGSYTWAKSIDTTSGIRNQGNDTLYPQNSYCLSCERGLSAFDVHHRVVTSVLYDLPVGKGKPLNITNPVANAVVGGWELGAPRALAPISATPLPPDISAWLLIRKLLPDSSAIPGAILLWVRESSGSTPKYTSNSTFRTRNATCFSSGLRRLTFSTTRTGRCQL